MTRSRCVMAALVACLAVGGVSWAGRVEPKEMRMAQHWFEQNWQQGEGAALPFSFTYAGQRSADVLARSPRRTEQVALDGDRTQYRFTWTDPETGLEVRVAAIVYSDFPAVEWTVYLKNTGHADAPILESIQGLDTRFGQRAGASRLHTIKGDYFTADSYEPLQWDLGPGASQRIAPEGGRPSNKSFPYFNLQVPGGGVIVAVGWPGQWAASFAREETGVRVVAGQELTHLSLKPGEEIRTPLIALLFWPGDDLVAAQNRWRRWYLAHVIPRPGGNLPGPMAVACAEGLTNFHNDIDNMRQLAETYLNAGIKLDYWWRDAGWYPSRHNDWWGTGTWEFDRTRFPQGLRPFRDWLHARGIKLITWFEPERVGDPDSWLAREHPNWLLGGHLLNLGDPEAWLWTVEHFDTLITDNGIDLYRQDFNMDPLDDWRKHDAPDREGMTENLYVQGYLAYWDELRRRHPNLLIDSCASGGRRNDLETMRRAVPLLRSDFQVKPEATVGNQGHTYGLSSWLPFTGTGCTAYDLYTARSYYLPCYGTGADMSTEAGRDLVKRAYAEARLVGSRMFGDYYPLTPYSLAETDWIAWQFNSPEEGNGVVQAFRRSWSGDVSRLFHLRGLDPKALYEVKSLDGKPTQKRRGQELLERGLTVEIAERPGSAISMYDKVKR